MPDKTSAERSSIGSSDGSLPAAGKGLPLVPMLVLAGIAALGAFATLFTVWARSAEPSMHEQLRIAMDEYTAGRFDLCQQIAGVVEVDAEQHLEDYRTREFLLGAAGVRHALQLEDPLQMRLALANSLPHLEWLQRTEFPAGRGAEGKELLGQALSTVGRYEAAVKPLQQAIVADPTLRRRLLLLLAETELRAGGPSLREALAHIDEFRALPNLPGDLLSEGKILQGRILTALTQWSAAKQALAAVPLEDYRDRADLAYAQMLIAKARSLIAERVGEETTGKQLPLVVTELLDEAIAVLQELAHRNDLEMGAPARYLEAVSHRLAGENEEALSLFASLRQSTNRPSEALAAGMEEAEMLAEMGQYADALLTVRTLVREIGDPAGFDPRWMSISDVCRRLQNIPAQMSLGAAFAEAVDCADSLPPMVSLAVARELRGEAHRSWGEHLKSQMQSAADYQERSQLESAARAQFRAAGAAFAEVAKSLFTTPEYIDAQWRAIEAYQAGRAYVESLELLEDYLRYEQRQMIPRGLLAQGKALLALGQPEEALEPLYDCVEEFPRDSLRFEASLLAAIAELEGGETARPRELLEENLYGGELNPDNPVFRDSKYVLAEALFHQAQRDYLKIITPSVTSGRLRPGLSPSAEDRQALAANQKVLVESITQLDMVTKWDREHDDIGRARRALYLKGNALRLAAFWPAIQAEDPETLDSGTRRRMMQERIDYLDSAREAYTALKDELNQELQRVGVLIPAEQAILRNCYMGIADSLFDKEDYAAAAKAYDSTAQEYLTEPLALEAMLREATCYTRLNKPDEAKRLYLRASDTLQDIPQEEDRQFARTTRYDRTEWASLIDWLGQG